MRILIVAFLFCLISPIVNAQAFQSRKPVICDDIKKVIESLNQNFEEKPVWLAKDQSDDTRYSLFVNQKTGSWTLIQFTSTVACILGVGEDSKFMFGDSI
jgi:hypothetical protein